MSVEFWQPGSIHGDEYFTRKEDAEIIADYLIMQNYVRGLYL